MFSRRLMISMILMILTIGVTHEAYAQSAQGPSLTYSTFLGGRSDDHIQAIAVDAQGNIYLAGSTYSTDFPGINGKPNNSQDIVVLSFDPSGSTLRWSAVIGGSGTDEARGLALDGHGYLWITGLTDSADFPISAGGSAFAGYYDLVVAKLDTATGALVYVDLYGDVSSDQGNAITVAPNGTVYLTGQISDAAGFRDVLVMALDGQRYTVLNAVSFGRERGEDMGNAIALDAKGNLYITGQTRAQGQDTEFPLVQPLQAQCGVGDSFGDCGEDAFVTKLNPALDTILYSTYLGGSYNGSEIGAGADVGTGIAVGTDGSIYVAGHTFANDFPVVNAMQTAKQGADNFPDAFVARLNPAANAFLFSTYLGGDDWDEAHTLALDGAGNIVVGGMTDAQNYPVLNALQPLLGNGICNLGGSERYCYDGFAVQLSPNGSLMWSTFLGGGYDDNISALALNSSGDLLLSGGSESHNFPVSPDAYQVSKGLQQDGFFVWLKRDGGTSEPVPTGPHQVWLPLVQR